MKVLTALAAFIIAMLSVAAACIAKYLFFLVAFVASTILFVLRIKGLGDYSVTDCLMPFVLFFLFSGVASLVRISQGVDSIRQSVTIRAGFEDLLSAIQNVGDE
jgi:hypothetical protein